MATFSDVLANLNSQNFGQGLAQYGNALYQQEENKKLVEGLRDFNEKRNAFEGEELKTTVEQLADAQSIPTGEENTVQKLAKMSSDLYQVYDRMGAYQNLYQPFITAFATLGKDGIKVANTLSKELDDKISMLETKAQVPSMALEYANNALAYQSNIMEYKQKREAIDKRNAIMSIQQAMTDNSGLSFWKLPKGQRDLILNTGYGDSQIKDYNKKINETISVLSGQFPDADKNTISEAVTEMAARYGMIVQGRQVENSPAYAKIKAETELQRQADLSEALSFAKRFTANWGTYDPVFKDAIKSFFQKGGQSPSVDKEGNWDGTYVATDIEGKTVEVPWSRIQMVYEDMIKFDRASSIIAATYPNFYNTKKSKSEDGLEFDTTDFLPEIMRSKYSMSYLDDIYAYNPWQKGNVLQAQRKQMENFANKKNNLFQDSTVKTPSRGYDQLFEDFVNGGIYKLFTGEDILGKD